jgi:hypothetical protein
LSGKKSHSWTLLVSAVAIVVLGGPLPAAAAEVPPTGAPPGHRPDKPLRLRPAKPVVTTGRPSPAQRQLRRQGYLVPNQRGYERAKARAARRAPGSASPEATLLAPRIPAASPSFAGIRDPNSGPPDTTGAVGTTRFIETVNTKFAIYSKTSTTPLSTGTLGSLWGTGSAFASDPQIIWDPGTGRFYYAGLILVSPTDNELTFGFSKTPSPNSAADFCNYAIGYGRELPDYPKLGDTRDFALIGVNTFSNSKPSGFYVGSDVIAIKKKPLVEGTCPALSNSDINGVFGIETGNGDFAFTPVPVNQTDPSGTGWVAATDGASASSRISLLRVTKAADGKANIQNPGTDMTVPGFSIPPNAPQSGTPNLLDTFDARLTQGVSAIDPARGTSGRVAIWTQHTVAGGAGAEVRWYEIDPGAHGLFQSGKASSASLFSFNGAISPNRAVRGPTREFGSDMAMTFNTSSSSTHPAIKVVSKLGTGPQSAPVTVKNSPASLDDYTCSTGLCRWGDYAGATPDPAAPSGSSRVWMVNEWVLSPSPSPADWGSWNVAVTP